MPAPVAVAFAARGVGGRSIFEAVCHLQNGARSGTLHPRRAPFAEWRAGRGTLHPQAAPFAKWRAAERLALHPRDAIADARGSQDAPPSRAPFAKSRGCGASQTNARHLQNGARIARRLTNARHSENGARLWTPGAATPPSFAKWCAVAGAPLWTPRHVPNGAAGNAVLNLSTRHSAHGAAGKAVLSWRHAPFGTWRAGKMAV